MEYKSGCSEKEMCKLLLCIVYEAMDINKQRFS